MPIINSIQCKNSVVFLEKRENCPLRRTLTNLCLTKIVLIKAKENQPTFINVTILTCLLCEKTAATPLLVYMIPTLCFCSPTGDNKFNVCLRATISTGWTGWTLCLLCSFAREGHKTISLDRLGLCFLCSLDTLSAVTLWWLNKSSRGKWPRVSAGSRSGLFLRLEWMFSEASRLCPAPSVGAAPCLRVITTVTVCLCLHSLICFLCRCYNEKDCSITILSLQFSASKCRVLMKQDFNCVSGWYLQHVRVAAARDE